MKAKLILATIAAVLLVVLLLPRTPDISIQDAARYGNIEAVKQHLSAGTDVNVKDWRGVTPLHFALGHRDIVELLISNGADVNAKDYTLGTTSLHAAAMWGDKEIADLLIAKGSDENAKDNRGRTPLHQATVEGHKEVAELLIAKGADVNAKNDGGWTPLDWADGEIARLLRRHGGKYSSIFSAAASGDFDAVQEFLATGTDVNKRGYILGATALHGAAMRGDKEIAELLIAKGADVHATEKDAMTPLHQAAVGGYKEMAELLIAKGADVNATDKNGKTPLDKSNRPASSFMLTDIREITTLIRKHGGKTGHELETKGK